jgi:hypothetical protein
MPYQVKSGSFLVIAATLAEAIRLFDSLSDKDGVILRDMDGIVLDPDRLRRILNDDEPH